MPLKSRSNKVGALLCLWLFCIAHAGAAEPAISYEEFVLKNGLRVILHKDTKLPLITVNVWYHVGSKNDPPGHAGLAHLVEHLMFSRIKNSKEDILATLERLGATDYNGTTDRDRTRYCATAPANALNTLLWIEAQRMAYLADSLTQPALEQARDIVRTEIEQAENKSEGDIAKLLSETVYPPGHPYHRMPLGSYAELRRLSLEQVREWITRYYRPDNAVLVVTGEIDYKATKETIRGYFEGLPSPAIAADERFRSQIETYPQRRMVEAFGRRAILYKIWLTPPYRAPVNDYLDLLAQVLKRRLVKRWSKESDISANVRLRSWELSGQFEIEVTGQKGSDLTALEDVIDREIVTLSTSGPGRDELESIRQALISSLLGDFERIGGLGGKADLLAISKLLGGDTNHYHSALDRLASATPDDVKQAARTWLGQPATVLTIGGRSRQLEASDAARNEGQAGAAESKRLPPEMPGIGPARKLRLPTLQRERLSSGLTLVVAPRTESTKVAVQLLIPIYSPFTKPFTPSTGQLFAQLINEQGRTKSGEALGELTQRLGIHFLAEANSEAFGVRIIASPEQFHTAIRLISEAIHTSPFDNHTVANAYRNLQATLSEGQSNPASFAKDILPYLTVQATTTPANWYGSGSSLADQVHSFRTTWIVPNNAFLVVAGNVAGDDVLSSVKRELASWNKSGVPSKPELQIGPAKPRVLLIQRPRSTQSVIAAGKMIPDDQSEAEGSFDVLRSLLANRINDALRGKGWAYRTSVGTRVHNGRKIWIIETQVLTDKTLEACRLIRKELLAISEHPPSNDDLDALKRTREARFPGTIETTEAFLEYVTRYARLESMGGYGKDSEKLQKLTVKDISNAARTFLSSDGWTWLISGDSKRLESIFQDAGFGEVSVLTQEDLLSK